MPRLLTLFGTAIIGIAVSASPMDAARLKSLGVVESSKPKVEQPGWRTPRDANQLFYLQRSMNSNTVVYSVRFDADGNIDARNPARIYWRRFDTTGEQKALKSYEYLAYGINVKRRKTPGEYTVTLRRLPQVPMLLRQTGPNKAELWVDIGGKMVHAVYAYARLEGSGIGQRVTGFTIHGVDPTTGNALSETFSVTGGEISR